MPKFEALTNNKVLEFMRKMNLGNVLHSNVPPATYGSGVIAGGESSQDTSAFLNCNFRVLSQSVCITDINFQEQSFSVFTELSLVPIHPELRQICLNLGTDALLPNELPEASGGRVTVNDEDAEYTRRDPLEFLVQCPDQSLRRLSQQMYDVLEDSEGELLINVPESCYDSMDEQMVVKVGIDVKVIKPRHVSLDFFQGIQFIGHFSREGILEKGAHMYTFRSNVLSSTRQWLPSLDAPDQLCLWRLEITVDAAFVAVASGELIDTVYADDMRSKVYHYQLLLPTSAVNIGFAVGHFTPVVQPDMSEITSFALPSLTALVKHTASTVDRVFEFFEELLSCRFPYSSYKQVFVDQAAETVISFSGMAILSVNILYHKKILDTVQETRQILALAVAQQFFGCFVNAAHWLDTWLMKSLARFFSRFFCYITGLFVERYFGTSEYMFQNGSFISFLFLQIKKMLNAVCEYESRWGQVVLRPLKNDCKVKQDLHFDARNSFTCSPLYADILFKKGHFVIRMLTKRLGKEPFFQVVQKILSVSMQFSQQQREPINWQHMTVSTESFFRTVSNVTGQELPTFLEQWIYGGGHANFQIQYAFNRKRNMIELEIRQDPAVNSGRQSYVGPVTVAVQELDGSFTHTIQIDSDQSKHDLQCHSKGRRQKKKKIPLSTGEELEIDLTNMDPDSPVLWIRIDPDLLLVRKINIRQPVYQWEYMLKYERDVLAQLHALDVLQRFPSPQVRTFLLETVENENFFYRVRCRAAFSLTEVVNKLPETWLGPPALLALFKKLFGCKSAPHIPKPNNFVVTSANLQLYFLMNALPQALARLRTPSNASLSEVHRFIIGLIRYNDNSTNRYSDDHYRASLISALAATVVPADNLDGNMTPDTLNSDMKETLGEFTHALDMDTLKPTFGHVVGISALQAIYQLQCNAHLPLDPKIFWLFAQPKIFSPMRQAALVFLIDMIHRPRLPMVIDVLNRLIEMSITDREPAIRYHIPRQLCERPPFFSSTSSEIGSSNPTNTKQLANKLWAIIVDAKTVISIQYFLLRYCDEESEDREQSLRHHTLNACQESRLRGHFIDLWFVLYGNGVPPVLRAPGSAPQIADKAENGAIRIAAISNVERPVDVLAESMWHSTTLDLDEPDSPINRVASELNDDMLQ
ncbi:unnamed protein product [Toxocara canis]|uniref:Transcription initiation factor TFIID subunit 2 n=1 Tax=Toxocara canis TaxID=6265 RepID=A0A183UPA2_TOXCA|nr:unnamed protein product [Toxocara canis]